MAENAPMEEVNGHVDESGTRLESDGFIESEIGTCIGMDEPEINLGKDDLNEPKGSCVGEDETQENTEETEVEKEESEKTPEGYTTGPCDEAKFGLNEPEIKTEEGSVIEAEDAVALEDDRMKKEDSEGLESEEECVHLSDSVLMFRNDPLCAPAQVYRGFLKSGIFGNQKIAVKYRPNNDENLKEAKILHSLGSHPNVVRFFCADVYRVGPFPAMYIAMELCQTLNLHDRIIQNKKDNVPFDPELALSHAKQIALGVEFIHKKGIINRDLKPQNVLFSVDGKSLKVNNFGLSKPLRHGRSITRQSFLGAGTDGYRAPETYNSDTISKSSDIYSLALVFYYIWSYGCHPFGDDPDDWNSNIKKNRDRDLSQLLIQDEDAKRCFLLLEAMLQFVALKRPTAEEVLDHPVFNKSMTTMQGSSMPSQMKPDEGKGKNRSVEGEKTMDEKESLEAILEEEKCQTLMNESKYVQALLKLNDLVNQGRNELSTQLMIAECNLQIGRKESADKAIDAVKVCAEHHCGKRELKAICEEYIKKSSHMQATILIPCLGEKLRGSPHSVEIADGIEVYIRKLATEVEKLVRMGGRSLVIAHDYGMPPLHKMYDSLCEIEGLPKKTQILRQVRSLNWIGNIFYEGDEYHKDLEYRNRAIHMMEENFPDPQKYEIYGTLLNNAAVAKRNLGFYQEAEALYIRSIDAKRQAVDFNNEESRQSSIKITENNLAVAQRRLGHML